MERDADCLFHALAFFEGCDGKALWLELANFMGAEAANHPGLEDQWLLAARELRANKWGGYMAIVAYSLLRTRRIMFHTVRNVAEPVAVEEVGHASIHGGEMVRVVHLLYHHDIGHYDALVELHPATRMGPPGRSNLMPSSPGNLQHMESSSLFAPMAAYSPAYIASWATQWDGRFISEEESKELLRLAGWLLQLLCMPPPTAHQFCAALRSWQARLRRRFGDRLLPWPWSFVAHGLII